jgi:hypothetical protein
MYIAVPPPELHLTLKHRGGASSTRVRNGSSSSGSGSHPTSATDRNATVNPFR